MHAPGSMRRSVVTVARSRSTKSSLKETPRSSVSRLALARAHDEEVRRDVRTLRVNHSFVRILTHCACGLPFGWFIAYCTRVRACDARVGVGRPRLRLFGLSSSVAPFFSG